LHQVATVFEQLYVHKTTLFWKPSPKNAPRHGFLDGIFGKLFPETSFPKMRDFDEFSERQHSGPGQ
jgi:hypothetical protein